MFTSKVKAVVSNGKVWHPGALVDYHIHYVAVDALMSDLRGHARLHAQAVVVGAGEDCEHNVHSDYCTTCQHFKVEAEHVQIRRCII